MLVRTTLVRALYLSARLVTAWPQLWNATSAMGTSTFQAQLVGRLGDNGEDGGRGNDQNHLEQKGCAENPAARSGRIGGGNG